MVRPKAFPSTFFLAAILYLATLPAWAWGWKLPKASDYRSVLKKNGVTLTSRIDKDLTSYFKQLDPHGPPFTLYFSLDKDGRLFDDLPEKRGEAGALFLKGLNHKKGYDSKEAAEFYRQSIEKDPDYFISWHQLGYYNATQFFFHSDVKAGLKARKCVLKAIDLNPINPNPWQLLAVLEQRSVVLKWKALDHYVMSWVLNPLDMSVEDLMASILKDRKKDLRADRLHFDFDLKEGSKGSFTVLYRNEKARWLEPMVACLVAWRSDPVLRKKMDSDPEGAGEAYADALAALTEAVRAKEAKGVTLDHREAYLLEALKEGHGRAILDFQLVGSRWYRYVKALPKGRRNDIEDYIEEMIIDGTGRELEIPVGSKDRPDDL